MFEIFGDVIPNLSYLKFKDELRGSMQTDKDTNLMTVLNVVKRYLMLSH